jgi:hypothetical protein
MDIQELDLLINSEKILYVKNLNSHLFIITKGGDVI